MTRLLLRPRQSHKSIACRCRTASGPAFGFGILQLRTRVVTVRLMVAKKQHKFDSVYMCPPPPILPTPPPHTSQTFCLHRLGYFFRGNNAGGTVPSPSDRSMLLPRQKLVGEDLLLYMPAGSGILIEPSRAIERIRSVYFSSASSENKPFQ